MGWCGTSRLAVSLEALEEHLSLITIRKLSFLLQFGQRSAHRLVGSDQEDHEAFQHTRVEQTDLSRAEVVEAYPA